MLSSVLRSGRAVQVNIARSVAKLDKCPHDGNVDLDARPLRSTLESIATPCSVKAKGKARAPPQLEITICDFKFWKLEMIELNMKIIRKPLAIPLHGLIQAPTGTP